MSASARTGSGLFSPLAFTVLTVAIAAAALPFFVRGAAASLARAAGEQRIGRAAFAVVAPGFFRSALLDDLKNAPAAGSAIRDGVPAIVVDGTLVPMELAHLPYLHSLTLPVAEPGDAVAFLAHASAALGGGVLWAQPASGMFFAGAGIAEVFTFSGADRFAEASRALRALRGRVVREDDELFPLLGGFAFDVLSRRDDAWREFPDGRLVVPRVLLQMTPAGSHLRVTLPSDTGPEEPAPPPNQQCTRSHTGISHRTDIVARS